MKNITTFVLVITLLAFNNLQAQFPGCPAVTATDQQGLANSQNIINLDCNASCVDLVATPFHAGATTSYTVNSIPHTPPIAYNEPGGNAISVNTDDVWSSVINLPFKFCYFGQTYEQCKIGSNGTIKFGNPSGTRQEWSFTASLPSSTLTDRGDVFGIYHDIDPSVNGTVKWYLVGQAPCRILCVVYNNLAQFSCTSKRSTHMMVLYETTNAIDVYVEKKELCTGWNGGRAIIGIQNPNNSAEAYVAPGRNSSPTWQVSTPEGWRFNPNGAPIYNVEWLVNNQVVSTNATFNVCPSQSTTYEARATYNKCDGTTVVATDFITVNPPANAPNITPTIVQPRCNLANGSVTINATGGTPPYQYSTTNSNFNNTNTYNNLSDGIYTFYVRDNSGCVSNVQVNLQSPDRIVFDIDTVINVKCFGLNTGAINLAVTGGSGALSYSLNNGASQNSGNFTNLTAGTYNIKVTDPAGCLVEENITISQPTKLDFVLDYTTPSVCNQSNGEIMTSITGGITPYSYTLNGLNVPNNDVLNLPGGNYTFIAQDGNNCKDTLSVVVAITSTVQSVILNVKPVTCFNGTDGEVTLSSNGGTAPYSYSINGIINNTPTFSGLSAGNYTVVTSDFHGCTVETQITVNQPDELIAEITPINDICIGTTIDIAVNAQGGNGGNQYLWATGQTTQFITDTPSSTTTYSIVVTDSKGCTDTANFTVNVLPLPIANISPEFTEGYPGVQVTFNNNSAHANQFNWDFGNGNTRVTTNLNPVSDYFQNVGDYMIVMTASNGICQFSDTAYVKVVPIPDPEIFVPNIFTPNNDGANDTWGLDLKFVNNVEVFIFNRWGNLMSTITDPAGRWDGKSNGQDALEGTYFYKYIIRDLKGKEHEGHGFFNLNR